MTGGDDLMVKLEQYQKTTSEIIEGKNREIEALSKVLNQLVERLEGYEGERPKPEGSPYRGVV